MIKIAKKKKKMRSKEGKKKKEKNYYYFIKTKNITATIYFLLAGTIALLILLTYFGILEFKLGG